MIQKFVRVALVANQVDHYNLPTAPPKIRDPRTGKWPSSETCQLEALPPDTIANILRRGIESLLDMERLQRDRRDERHDRRSLLGLLNGGIEARDDFKVE